MMRSFLGLEDAARIAEQATASVVRYLGYALQH